MGVMSSPALSPPDFETTPADVLRIMPQVRLSLIKFGFHLLLIYSEHNTILTGSLTSLQGAKVLICTPEIIPPQWLKPQDSMLRE